MAEPPSELFPSIGSQAERTSQRADDQPNPEPAPASETREGADPDDGDRDGRVVEEIESLCMNCYEQGTTRLLLTVIPYFREIVIMSFRCDHCNFANNEIQAAGAIQPHGVRYELRPNGLPDLSRSVVKSDTATIRFVELDVELPPGRGQMTNVEGLLLALADDLDRDQPVRAHSDPSAHAKIATVVARARAMRSGSDFPFRLVLDDPAGNSFIAPDPADGVGRWQKRNYPRTPEQNAALGLTTTTTTITASASTASTSAHPSDSDPVPPPDEVYSFPTTCPGCARPCDSHMKMVDIPHFRQVVLMSIVCPACGFRSSDIKTGGAVPPRGERTTLAVRPSPAPDLSRDILKSESCRLDCPELHLQLSAGTLGGRFTTVEGLLTQVRDELRAHIFHGDAAPAPAPSDPPDASPDPPAADPLLPDPDRARWTAFFARLDAAIRGDLAFSLVLSDPMAASFVQPLVLPPDPDPQLHRESYDRTEDEEDELGLRDMNVDNYLPPDPDADAAPDPAPIPPRPA